MHPRAVQPAAPLPAQSEVQTMPVESPDSLQPQPQSAALGRSVRIGLLLPLRSESLGHPARVLRAGFMAAHSREGAGFTVEVIETGDGAQEVLDAYARAAQANDIVVGPLARSAVSVVASSPAERKPTIALNNPDAGTVLPPNMLVVGLSIEDEARQAATWIDGEQPGGGSALILSGSSTWERRIATAFADEWARLGRESQMVELPSGNGYETEMAIGQLNNKVQAELPPLIFAALDTAQARKVRGVIGPDVPFYGAASVSPRVIQGDSQPELDGVRVLDLPWVVERDSAAMMAWPRWDGAPLGLDMERLYGLGIDAFRVAREIALERKSFELDGVTGRLKVNYGAGNAQFQRAVPPAVIQAGATRSLLIGH